MKILYRLTAVICVFATLYSFATAAEQSPNITKFLTTAPSSLYVSGLGKQPVEHLADQPFAVGSAFKLAVLAALNAEIDRSHISWTDILVLTEKNRSLPSGYLQQLTAGAPLTLHSLALLMIAVSDNTATDMLIDRLGRRLVEVQAGAPVLTTREFFILKADADFRRQFLTTDDRTTFLQSLQQQPLPPGDQIHAPWTAGVEWMITTRQLCHLMQKVKHLDVVSVNPGLASREHWNRIAFKGGGETGVLNLTTALTSPKGNQYCVSATWNAPSALDTQKLYDGYKTLLKSLQDPPD